MTVCVRAMPEGLTALRVCDSTQHILLRPRHTGPEKPIPFGGVPFHPAAISVAFFGSYCCQPRLYHALFNCPHYNRVYGFVKA